MDLHGVLWRWFTPRHLPQYVHASRVKVETISIYPSNSFRSVDRTSNCIHVQGNTTGTGLPPQPRKDAP